MEGLRGKTDRSLNMQGLGASPINQLSAHLLERLDLTRGKGDTDLVDLLYISIDISKPSSYPSSVSENTNRALAKVLLRLLVRHVDDIGG